MRNTKNKTFIIQSEQQDKVVSTDYISMNNKKKLNEIKIFLTQNKDLNFD